MHRRTGAAIVLDTLESLGVDTVFGYPGGAIMPLYDALYDHRIAHVLVRHEAAAVFAASGYARSTGRPGVCVATSGPGATNLVTGIVDAMLDNVPLIALTGQVRTAVMGTDAFQEVDVAAITHAVTKRNIVVRSIEQLEPVLRAAFHLATGQRPGPVLIDLPTDVLRALEAESVPLAREPAPALCERPRASAQALDAAVAALQRAERPVLIVGGGARWSGATEIFRSFASRIGAPVAATLHGLGCADPGDPAFLGMLGMHGWKRANHAVAGADVIFALGMRFDDRVTGDPAKFAPNAHTIVHADVDAAEFNKVVRTQIPLHGDLRETLVALDHRLARAALPSFEGWRARACASGEQLPRDDARSEHLSATDFLDALFAALPADAIVTTDVGQHQMWAAQRVRVSHPQHFLTSGGLGSMGFGLPAAIGAQIAHPERMVVAIVGDGGFQMSMAELATLRRHDLPVKIVLLDNRNLGMVRQWQELFYNARYSATALPDNPEFTTIARAYGIEGRLVDHASAIPGAIERMLESAGPMLLHCACFPHENVWPIIPSGKSLDDLMEPVPA
ncbi:MAG TPA: biosynthetic-type acetolactate synthase large subunit [Candidatus Acidoferrales bacterium]|nr:biosynthetic-type acetolactate synthase large subunit [Candidatus Acidoferrales bacterium]